MQSDSILERSSALSPGAPLQRPTVHEFFAGAGMVRVGLGPGWRCAFANDVDPLKAQAYRANFGSAELRLADVASLQTSDIPETADLTWGSFPCQDLSLAGAGAGLDGARSGLFHAFWRLMERLVREGRAPRLVAVENVCGTLSARGGRDFGAICDAFVGSGYRVGALVVDAELFVPQSRPRLFVIGVREDAPLPRELCAAGPEAPFHTLALRRAVQGLQPRTAARWVWWRLAPPQPRRVGLADLIEATPEGVAWRTPAETERLLSLMSPLHRAKVEAQRGGRGCVGAVYRRTRRTTDGVRQQRAEVRFDQVAGCLRTPAGGSSRQLLLVVEGDGVRSRWLTPRETARLMGLPDSYRLPASANAACRLTGDGVVAPVVAHLARQLFEPLLGLAPAWAAPQAA